MWTIWVAAIFLVAFASRLLRNLLLMLLAFGGSFFCNMSDTVWTDNLGWRRNGLSLVFEVVICENHKIYILSLLFSGGLLDLHRVISAFFSRRLALCISAGNLICRKGCSLSLNHGFSHSFLFLFRPSNYKTAALVDGVSLIQISPWRHRSVTHNFLENCLAGILLVFHNILFDFKLGHNMWLLIEFLIHFCHHILNVFGFFENLFLLGNGYFVGVGISFHWVVRPACGYITSASRTQ